MIFMMDEAFEKRKNIFISIDVFYSRFILTLKRIVFSHKKSRIRVEMKRSLRNIEYEVPVFNYLLQDFLKAKKEQILYSIYGHTSINLQLYNLNNLRNSILVNRRKNEISTSSTMKFSGKKKWQTISSNYIDRHFFRTIFSKSFQVCVLKSV